MKDILNIKKKGCNDKNDEQVVEIIVRIKYELYMIYYRVLNGDY